MRKLQTTDLFAFCRLVKTVELKDTVKSFLSTANTIEDVADRGMEFVFALVDAAAGVNSERAIYEFLTKPFEMSADEIAALPIDEFISGIKSIGTAEIWQSFFGSAAKLTK